MTRIEDNYNSALHLCLYEAASFPVQYVTEVPAIDRME